MKKGLLLIAFLIFAATAQAQLGLRAGLGSSNFSNGDVQRGFTSLIRPHLCSASTVTCSTGAPPTMVLLGTYKTKDLPASTH